MANKIIRLENMIPIDFSTTSIKKTSIIIIIQYSHKLKEGFKAHVCIAGTTICRYIAHPVKYCHKKNAKYQLNIQKTSMEKLDFYVQFF